MLWLERENGFDEMVELWRMVRMLACEDKLWMNFERLPSRLCPVQSVTASSN